MNHGPRSSSFMLRTSYLLVEKIGPLSPQHCYCVTGACICFFFDSLLFISVKKVFV